MTSLLRIIWASLTFFVFLLPSLLITMFIRINVINNNLLYKYFHFWARMWLFLNNIKLEIIGIEKLDNSSQYIFTPNHSSNADTILMAGVLNRKFTALGKKAVGKIPLMRHLFNTTCILIDRKNKKDREECLQRLLEKAQREHSSIIIFPEGTFSLKRNKINPFFPGAFELGLRSNLSVVPITLVGVREVFGRSGLPLKNGKVTCIIDSPIDTATIPFNEKNTKILKQTVFNTINSHINS